MNSLQPSRALPLAALVTALVALAAVLFVAWHSNDAEDALRQQLGAKLGEQAELQKQAQRALEQLGKDLKDQQNHLAQLEGKLGEIQGQRVALEEMTRELARAPDEWLLAEIEQTLNIASRELTLAGNVRSALIALQAADQRLVRSDKPHLVNLRRAINQDSERLKALPILDSAGISVKLDNLMTLVPTLPLAVPDVPVAELNREAAPAAAGETWVARLARDFWQEMKELIRIREINAGDPALIAPRQSYFLRENLKLRLLAARTALIARDEVNYKEDLKVARELLGRYFDPKAKVNQNAQQLLRQLADNPLSIATPDITASLNAVRAARAARERPAR
ncbi:MAG TPA: uroporphyrinogen-III C-methyltransferase [Usitatibacteraceae bacterium]|nr:uroporphyrinogen-III C-methyltransferase [Usitatibacteraceae bacterium]